MACAIRRGGCWLPLFARHRRDKAVAPAWDVGDVALARLAVTERLAQRGDMNPQAPLVDDRVWPGARDQQILVNCLAGALNKRDENIQGSAA